MDRHLVADTGILCPGCQGATIIIEEPGSETARWARCPNCRDYLYYVGHVVCVGNGKMAAGLSQDQGNVIKGLLGPATLLPGAEEHIRTIREKLGLPLDE